MKPTVPAFELMGRLAITIAMLALCGCGGGSDSADREPSGRSAAITFQISVAPSSDQSTRVLTGHAMSEPDICNDYLIDTIGVQVLQTQDDAEVASAQEACAAHSLTIADVPAGKSLYVVCQGYVTGKSVWQGRAGGIVAEAGQNTDIGVIDMHYIGRDSTAPEIASTFPAADAANVDVFAPIVVVFTEKLAPSTIPESAITVANNDTPVSGQLGYDPDSQTLRFSPANAFKPQTTYTVTLQPQDDGNATIADIDGHLFTDLVSWQFTTRGADDNARPQVVVTSPLDGAANVAAQASVSALFSEPMDPDSLTGNVMQVTSDQGAVSGQTAYNTQTRTLSFTPDSGLKNATFYTAVVSTQARDLAKNTLLEPYEWQFLIGAYIISTSVIPESGCGGAISPADAVVVHGEDSTFDVLVNPYYHLSGLMVDGNPVSPATAYSFENVTENHAIQAIIKSNAEKISKSVDLDFVGNYSINANGQMVWRGRKKPTESDPEPDYDIYFYDGSDVTNISETDNPDGHDQRPKINANGQVVWLARNKPAGSDSEPKWAIYYYDESKATNISGADNPDGNDDDNLQINANGQVVWIGRKKPTKSDPDPDLDIYFYDGSDVTNISDTDNPDSDDYNPQINANGQVVWIARKKPTEFDPDPDLDVFFYDGSDVTNISETDYPDVNDFKPQINANGQVVWTGSKRPSESDPKPDLDIYFYDGSDVTNISETDNPDGNDNYPQINANGQVVWTGFKKATESDPLPDPTDIYYYYDSKVTNISKAGNPNNVNSGPQINANGQVVWTGRKKPTKSDPDPDLDVYYYYDSKVTNISEFGNPDGDDGGPQINANGQVVWQGIKKTTESDPEPDWDVYYYYDSKVTNISESDNPDDHDGDPQILANGQVAWQSQNNIYLSVP